MKANHVAMNRIPEPEKMTGEEEYFYAKADYSEPHERYVSQLLAATGQQADLKVVDLGCGPGDILIRLRKRAAWSLWGLDMSSSMLNIAAHHEAAQLGRDFYPINWTIADIKKTGIPSGFFDVILSNSVLHHLSDPDLYWQEVKRIARRGSYILVRDLRRPLREAEADHLVHLHVGNESTVVQTHYKSSLLSAYTVSEVKQQLAKAGLRGLAVLELDDRYLDISGYLEVD